MANAFLMSVSIYISFSMLVPGEVAHFALVTIFSSQRFLGHKIKTSLQTSLSKKAFMQGS